MSTVNVIFEWYRHVLPKLDTISKGLLYRSICLPTLSYGLDTINISCKCIKQLESTQGGIIKQVCGFCKQFHHSKLLRALVIDNVKTCINNYYILCHCLIVFVLLRRPLAHSVFSCYPNMSQITLWYLDP